MYFFYFNFPNFKSKPIVIHHSKCGNCNSGEGKLGSFSNRNGFWAGPFKDTIELEEALNRLNNLLLTKFTFTYCKHCKSKL